MYGQDVCFDFQNYHLYIPYALLNGRAALDIIPAGALHTFFNPLLDVPSYLLFTSLADWPRLVGFLMGAYYGLLLFALWKASSCVFTGDSLPEKGMRLFTFLLAGTGLATLGQIGRFTNEVQTAWMGITACYFLFYALLRRRAGGVAAAVFIASFTAGLKYTAGPVAVGVCLGGAYVLWRNKCSWKQYLAAVLAAAGGFLLADGYFLYKKWVDLGNPLFPYFNHIFKSPYFADQSLPNGFATPRGWKEWLFLPFLRFNFRVLEYHLDIRLILGVVSFWTLAGWRIFAKKAAGTTLETVCLLLFAGTYGAWVLLFGNMRYTICLEAFSAWLFALALRRLLPLRAAAVIVLATWVALMLKPLPNWHRHPFMEKTLVMPANVSVPDDAFVLIAGHLSFLIPFLNPHTRYAGGVWFDPEKLPEAPPLELTQFNWLQPADYRHHFTPVIRREIEQHPGPVYVLSPATPWMWKDALWADYGLKVPPSGKDCRFFVVSPDVIYEGFVLCKAQKVS